MAEKHIQNFRWQVGREKQVVDLRVGGLNSLTQHGDVESEAVNWIDLAENGDK